MCCLVTISRLVHAETLFGPGSITIATNEAILINMISEETDPQLFFDGTNVQAFIHYGGYHFAFAGPHALGITNADQFITFQRLQGSAIKTILVTEGTTNFISVPDGKTIQFFAYVGHYSIYALPLNSSNRYELYHSGYEHPVITGPATIEASSDLGNVIYSYYFTDDILQLPPEGFVSTPAPTLEVNVEKSYNLTNWTPVGAFNTSAEAGAFYRLRMLK